MDPFPSIANPAEDAFVLFDNVRVEDLSAAALQPPGITSQPLNHFEAFAPETQVLFQPPSASGSTDPWLRLTTFNAANLPNPTISTNQVLQFDIYTDNNLYVGIGFRETSTTAPIGANGGTTGTTDNTKIPPKDRYLAAGQWTTLSFFLPYEPVRGFIGNGVLEASTGKGVFEHLEFVPAAGPGTYNLCLDNLRVIDLAP